MHVPRLSTLKPAWMEWAAEFSRGYAWRDTYDDSGDPIPAKLDALLETEGVDRALLFCEYSPRATGIQTIEDLLPIRDHNPDRFRLVANINPHLHHPIASEVERQLDLGAVALKIHPVHAGFSPDDPQMRAAYAVCVERGVPVIIHSGVSSFPGSQSKYGNPELMLDVVEEFPGLNFVFAHGGRGWWYDTAAFLALAKPNVWLDLAGLPPKKLPEYYARFDLTRIATKWIFGTDWPGVPGIKRNADAIAEIGLPNDVLEGVLSGNATKVFPGV
ncbi:amidohydrolase family protein [Kibdelosporangium aridum]|uniref:amidohydrolase family protein n=1 Tax=Kibdelosporangium aridum TaxID=2030 RepID=UPI0035E4AADB